MSLEPTAPRTRLGRVPAVWLVLTAIASVQFGAAFAKGLFAAVPPLAVAWLRLASAAVVLLALARPRLRGRSAAAWRSLAIFAACLVTMNVSIYLAFAHIPIGIAVTVEFLGPLAVAVAGSRRASDLLWVVLAGTGVLLLGLRGGALNWVGLAFAALAGLTWAGYIVFGARVGHHWSTLDALALSCAAGAAVITTPALLSAGATVWRPHVLAVGIAVGVLSSVVPYSCELAALTRIPTAVFGILMSLEPAVAAAAAFLILREVLGWQQWFAMGLVTAASVGATWAARRGAAPPIVD